MPEVTTFIDMTKCVGCRGCQVACKEWHELGANLNTSFVGGYQNQAGLAHERWTTVEFYERPAGEGMQWFFRKHQCIHCSDPPCVGVCPTGALYRTEYGNVHLERQKCIGCKYCIYHCPWQVPQYNAELNKVSKCTLCTERIANRQEPACVKTCVSKTLTFGTRDEMLGQAQKRLGSVKNLFPRATIYNPAGVEGTHVVYLLPGAPEEFGLPAQPSYPFTVSLWKSVVRPAGMLFLGATLTGILAGTILGRTRTPAPAPAGKGGGSGDNGS